MSAAPPPVVLAVDEDPDSLAAVRHELDKRYGADYRIVAEASPSAAFDLLRELAQADEPVAIVLADLHLRELSGPELLDRVAVLHPAAKRALTVAPWVDQEATRSMMVDILAQGAADYFVLKPTETASEHFHRVVTEFLDEWTRAHTSGLVGVRMVADEPSPRTRELVDLLQRNNVPAALLPEGSR